MKRNILLLTMALLTIFSFLMIFYVSWIFAMAGCCKERETRLDEWIRNGLSYQDCIELNRRRDRDHWLDPSGRVWWDIDCE